MSRLHLGGAFTALLSAGRRSATTTPQPGAQVPPVPEEDAENTPQQEEQPAAMPPAEEGEGTPPPEQEPAAQPPEEETEETPMEGERAAARAARMRERARFAAVMDHGEYPGREGLAHSLLVGSNMTSDQIGHVLARTPKAQSGGASAQAQAFAAAMARESAPALGAGNHAPGGVAGTAATATEFILASAAKARGQSVKPG